MEWGSGAPQPGPRPPPTLQVPREGSSTQPTEKEEVLEVPEGPLIQRTGTPAPQPSPGTPIRRFGPDEISS